MIIYIRVSWTKLSIYRVKCIDCYVIAILEGKKRNFRWELYQCHGCWCFDTNINVAENVVLLLIYSCISNIIIHAYSFPRGSNLITCTAWYRRCMPNAIRVIYLLPCFPTYRRLRNSHKMEVYSCSAFFRLQRLLNTTYKMQKLFVFHKHNQYIKSG